MNTAVVTGGMGFIGTHVVRALSAGGYSVRVAGTSVRSDLLTAARIAELGDDLDLVIHCAGGSSVAFSVTHPLDDFDRTVPPFAALLEHVRVRAPRARVVLLSSAAVYGSAAAIPTPESSVPAPVSPYGVHKRMCEELCLSYGRNFGVSSLVIRLFSVYGPGLRKQLLWDACQKARAGDLIFGGTGDEERDWLHVEDAASLVLACADHASPDVPILNGGSGSGTRVRDVVGMIAAELGAGELRFSGEVRPGDPKRYIADVTRARALGWHPAIELPDGVRDYVAWFREQG